MDTALVSRHTICRGPGTGKALIFGSIIPHVPHARWAMACRILIPAAIRNPWTRAKPRNRDGTETAPHRRKKKRNKHSPRTARSTRVTATDEGCEPQATVRHVAHSCSRMDYGRDAGSGHATAASLWGVRPSALALAPWLRSSVAWIAPCILSINGFQTHHATWRAVWRTQPCVAGCPLALRWGMPDCRILSCTCSTTTVAARLLLPSTWQSSHQSVFGSGNLCRVLFTGGWGHVGHVRSQRPKESTRSAASVTRRTRSTTGPTACLSPHTLRNRSGCLGRVFFLVLPRSFIVKK